MPEARLARLRTLKAEADVKKARLRQCDTEAVEYVRPIASAALDAYLESLDAPDHHNRMADELPALLDFAYLDYLRRYPRARGARLWTLQVGGRKYKYISQRSVVCRFCRTKLGSGFMGTDYSNTSWVRPHTTQCALESLSGLRTPSAPGSPVIVVQPVLPAG